MPTSLQRAISILHALREHGPLALSDLSRATGLPKATTHRLVSLLEAERFISRSSQNRYRLGAALLPLASAAVSHMELRGMAHPYLSRLRDVVEETVHLGVLSGTNVVYVDKIPAPHMIQMKSSVGSAVPAHVGALGKSLLAHLPPADLDDIVKRIDFSPQGPKSITSPTELVRQLDLVRASGFAVDDEETEVGVRCVGAVVRDHDGAAVAAVSISGPTSRIAQERLTDLVECLLEVTNAISVAMGFDEVKEIAAVENLGAAAAGEQHAAVHGQAVGARVVNGDGRLVAAADERQPDA